MVGRTGREVGQCWQSHFVEQDTASHLSQTAMISYMFSEPSAGNVAECGVTQNVCFDKMGGDRSKGGGFSNSLMDKMHAACMETD